jgi:TonB family protein
MMCPELAGPLKRSVRPHWPSMKQSTVLTAVTLVIVTIASAACTTTPTAPSGTVVWSPSAWYKRPPEPTRTDSACQSLEAPKRTRTFNPNYPDELRKARIEGVVYLSFIVSPDGTVHSPKVVNASHPALARACLEASLQWHYTPVLCNGRAVEVRYFATCAFWLEQGPFN